MNTDPAQLLSALQWRYATKQFDPAKPIAADVWEALKRSLVLAPSSFGLQPWRFLVVEDPATREALKAESWNQPQVTDAARFIVLTARTGLSADDIKGWISCLAHTQGKTPEDFAMLQGMIEGFTGSMSEQQLHAWNIRQVYIALGQLMTSAALLGVDSCPMEGIAAAAYDRILGLEGSGYATAVACALGHRSAEDKYAAAPKARYPLETVIRNAAG